MTRRPRTGRGERSRFYFSFYLFLFRLQLQPSTSISTSTLDPSPSTSCLYHLLPSISFSSFSFFSVFPVFLSTSSSFSHSFLFLQPGMPAPRRSFKKKKLKEDSFLLRYISIVVRLRENPRGPGRNDIVRP